MGTDNGSAGQSGSVLAMFQERLEKAEQGQEPVPEGGRVLKLELGRIQASPHQHRTVMDEQKLSELLASIQSGALIQPIVVRELPEAPGQYRLVGGHRRLEAYRRLHTQAVGQGDPHGWARIPAVVLHLGSEVEARLAGLAENLMREDPQPLDIAQAFASLHREDGMTAAQIASRFGWEPRKVERYLDLGQAPAPLLELFRRGSRTREGQKGKALLQHLDAYVLGELLRLYRFYLEKKKKRPEWALERVGELVKLIADQEWGFRQVEEEVRSRIKGRKKPEPRAVAPVYLRRDPRSVTFYLDRLSEAGPEAREEIQQALREVEALLG